MLNSKKLLYILPDVAYVADLLPGKKDHTFSIQSFRQINGEFLDDNEFIAANVEKLIKKLDPDQYHLVLPDFLFTNTIVEVGETSEAKIKEHIKEKLLPSLDISKDSHELKTFVLTEHGGKAKVQLSALEKSVMNAVSTYAGENKIEIAGVSPLSWTVKSIISLEPSISILQMGSRVYLAQHYIGVDQTISDSVEEVQTLAESIKTLKGAEPSIQTVYLSSNNLVEENLKELLSDTLPLQQLASFKEDESEMPSYVKHIIESGMRSLSIEDFSVPIFPLSKPTGPVVKSSDKKDEEKESEVEESTPTPGIAELDTSSPEESDLPKPSAAVTAPATVSVADTDTDEETKESTPDKEDKTEAAVENKKETEGSPQISEEPSKEEDESEENKDKAKEEMKEGKEAETKEAEPSKVEPKEDKDSEAIISSLIEDEKPETTEEGKTKDQTKEEPTVSVIKNKSGIQPMVKMVLISIAVFFATIAVGVGVGLAFISLSQRSQPQASPEPSPVAIAEPSPSPSPSPSPEPEIDPKELSILVVNATTKAGYAGETKSILEEENVGAVKAGNAKGDYDEGFYILMKEENSALTEFIEKVTDKTYEFSDEVTVEDASSAYDAVIVLAE